MCLHWSSLCSHMCLFSSRRCSGREGFGQSSGAIQTDCHALCSLLPQTQGLQRRDGGAAVRQLGWPGLCWKDFALSLVNTTPSYYLWINVNTYSLVCFCMSLFMKVLSDAYPRSLTVLTLLYMLTMQQPMAISCTYGLIHLFIYELYFFNLWTPLFWVHSFLCAPFWFTTWTSSLNGIFTLCSRGAKVHRIQFCRKLFGIYSVYLQYSREQKRMCYSFIFKKIFQKIQKFLICCNFFNSLMLHMVNEKKLN